MEEILREQCETLRRILHDVGIERDRYRAELENIANANTAGWDNPADFKAWAQNRAQFTLNQ